MLLAGCGGDEPEKWYQYNVDIAIELRDSEGGNWFDAHRSDEDDMRDNRVKITYKGEVYPMVWINPNTRADIEPDLPDWDENGRNPFRLKGYYETDGAPVQLLFGEFGVYDTEYRGESFTIDWGDGTESVVTFDLYVSGRKGEASVINSAVWVESGLGAGTRNDNGLVLKIVK
jgi:hypothetical protein